jgi:hypothetical protein
VHTRKNSISVYIGPSHSRLIDDAYSQRLLFRGTNLRLGISYSRENQSYRFRFAADALVGSVKSKSGDLPSDFKHFHPAVEYVRKIKSVTFLGQELTLLPGLSFGSSNYILNNQYIFDNISILSLHGVYASVGCEFDLAVNHRLHIRYQLPLVVYSNRVVWNGGASDITYDDGDHVLRTLMNRGSLGYVDVFRNVHFNVNHEMVLGAKIYFVTGYRFAYINNTSSGAARIYSNEVVAGFNIRF